MKKKEEGRRKKKEEERRRNPTRSAPAGAGRRGRKRRVCGGDVLGSRLKFVICCFGFLLFAFCFRRRTTNQLGEAIQTSVQRKFQVPFCSVDIVDANRAHCGLLAASLGLVEKGEEAKISRTISIYNASAAVLARSINRSRLAILACTAAGEKATPTPSTWEIEARFSVRDCPIS
jgi:hypothetical protein